MNSIDVRVYSENNSGDTVVNSALAVASMTVDEILKLFDGVENIYKIEIEPFM